MLMGSSEILDLIYDADGEERFIKFAEKELEATIIFSEADGLYSVEANKNTIDVGISKTEEAKKYVQEHPEEAEKAMHSMIPRAGTKAFDRHIEDIVEAMQSLLVLNCDGCTEGCPFKKFCTVEL